MCKCFVVLILVFVVFSRGEGGYGGVGMMRETAHSKF